MKKIIVCFIILMIGMGVCGCDTRQNDGSTFTNSSSTDIELSERQINILKQRGMPTDVNALTYSQLNAIETIEDMLIYLENKYGKSFEYVGYTATGNLEKETLRACTLDRDPMIDSFDVTKTEDGYEDDYMHIEIRDDYAEYVEELMISNLQNDRVRVFAEIYETELDNIPVNKEEYNSNVSSWKGIFIYISNIDELSNYTASITQILKDNNLRYDCDIIFLKENVINELTKYNYSDYLTSDYYHERRTVEVD